MDSLGILGNGKYSFIAINFKNILDMTLNYLMESLGILGNVKYSFIAINFKNILNMT